MFVPFHFANAFWFTHVVTLRHAHHMVLNVCPWCVRVRVFNLHGREMSSSDFQLNLCVSVRNMVINSYKCP